jgi:hypothetical protein
MSSQLSRPGACFSALTRDECWDFPASLVCVAGILYGMVSSHKSASWTLHLHFHTVTSEQLFHRKFPVTYFSCLICYATLMHWPLPGPTDERKVSFTILSFFQMNNVTASGLISPHYTCSPTLQLVLFYVPPLMMVPEQVYLHGQWLGKRHQEFPSNGWGEFTLHVSSESSLQLLVSNSQSFINSLILSFPINIFCGVFF